MKARVIRDADVVINGQGHENGPAEQTESEQQL